MRHPVRPAASSTTVVPGGAGSVAQPGVAAHPPAPVRSPAGGAWVELGYGVGIIGAYAALLAVVLGRGGTAAAGGAGLAAALVLVRRLRRAPRGWPWVVAACVASFPLFVRASPYWIFTGALSALYFLAGLGLNIQVGSAGIANLAGAAFFGSGAYSAGLLATRLHWPGWATVPAGTAAAVLIGALLFVPVLKTRGYYLALVTIAFGAVFTLLLTNMAWDGGPQGVKDIPGLGPAFDAPLRLGPWTLHFYARYFFLIAAVATLGLWGAQRLAASRRGAHWNAVRDDEVAARCAGVDVDRVMLEAFSVGNAFIGCAGALYAHLVGFIAPADFNFPVSLVLLSIPILGGLDSVPGTAVAAGLLIFLAEKLRAIADYRFLIYGALVVAILVIAPAGLLPPRPRRYPAGRRGDWGPRDRLAPPAPSPPSAPLSAGGSGAGARLGIEALVVRFGGLRALDGVTLAVDAGEVCGIIGPNGSGKTTLFNAAVGLYPAAAGRILLDHRDITGLPTHRISRLGVARTFQQNRVLAGQSVLDNVLLGRRGWPIDEASEWLAFFNPELPSRLADPAGDLPLIDRRRLEIVRALLAAPRLLLLDEPTAGLNPEETARMVADIRRVRTVRPGLTIVVIEHDMSVIAGLCGHVVALGDGRVIAEGRFEDVTRHPQVLEAYLGPGGAVVERGSPA